MACGGCQRNKNNKAQPKKQTDDTAQRVPRKDYELRVLQCNSCPASTKFLKNGQKQVTIKSICTESGRLLITALKDKTYECPLQKFGKLK